MSDFDRRFSGYLITFDCTVRPAYNATARDRFFLLQAGSVSYRNFGFSELQILGTVKVFR